MPPRKKKGKYRFGESEPTNEHVFRVFWKIKAIPQCSLGTSSWKCVILGEIFSLPGL